MDPPVGGGGVFVLLILHGLVSLEVYALHFQSLICGVKI